MREGGRDAAAIVPVAIAVPLPLSRSLSPSSVHFHPTSNRSWVGVGAPFVPIVPLLLRLFPLPNVPILAARSGSWGCCGDGGGGGGHHRPRRHLAVVVVVRWGVLGRPCLCWCPRPHPLSLSLSPPCPAPLSLLLPCHRRRHSARSLSSLSSLLPVSTPQADARGGGPG